jgi:arsenate reductase (thioredoxin)
MTDSPYNVLFLCTGNSARSIIAEAILNKVGAGDFRAYSAGSQPKGQVHPETLSLLQSLGYDVTDLRSKSWLEFTEWNAPRLDFIFTVCDSAGSETCPIWPGKPASAHWGIPDPADASGSPAEVSMAFRDTYRLLNQRIVTFTALPLRSLDRLSLQTGLRDIGHMEGSTARATEAT